MSSASARRSTWGLSLGLFVALVAIALLGLCSGLYRIPLGQLLSGGVPEVALVVTQFRIPRMVLALLVGAGLSVSGVVMQGVLRNDLATPGLMGVQSGGQVAVLLTVALFPGVLPTLALPAASFLGASAILGLVLVLAERRGRIDPNRVILIGLAVSLAVGALTSVLSLFLPLQMFDFLSAWMSGSLERANTTYLLALAPWVLVLTPVAWIRARSLNVLALGEEPAIGLGVRIQAERLLWLLLAAGLAAACAAVDGGIAFLGLLAPHIGRRLVGHDHRRLIPVSLLVGMVLLLSADVLGRVFTPHKEIPAGVLVTAFGGPYFLWLLLRR